MELLTFKGELTEVISPKSRWHEESMKITWGMWISTCCSLASVFGVHATSACGLLRWRASAQWINADVKRAAILPALIHRAAVATATHADAYVWRIFRVMALFILHSSAHCCYGSLLMCHVVMVMSLTVPVSSSWTSEGRSGRRPPRARCGRSGCGRPMRCWRACERPWHWLCTPQRGRGSGTSCRWPETMEKKWRRGQEGEKKEKQKRRKGK